MDLARSTLIVLTLVAVGLAGCSQVGKEITAERPEWHSGHTWSYTYEETYSSIDSADGEQDNWTEEDSGRIVREVLNTTLDLNGTPIYLLAEQRDGGGARLAAVKQADLDEVYVWWSYGMSCLDPQCAPEIELEYYEAAVEFPPYLDFPLKTGKTWGATVDMDEEGDFGASLTVAAAVQGAAVVQLPMGSTEAAKVNIVMRPTDMAEFEAAIKAEGEAEGYQVDVIDITAESAETVYYSPQYKAIVQRESTSAERFYARGTDPEGQPFEFHYEFQYERQEILDGARLAVKPERALADVPEYLSGAAPLDDPAGEEVAEAFYTLGIDPPSATINAGAGETASFSAVIDGDKPADHKLYWTVTGPSGVVANGTGKDFTVGVDKPGMYAVGLESRQDGASASAAESTLVADWIATSTLGCDDVVVFSMQGCEAGALPVHPGIQRLLVRVTPGGPLENTAGGLMRVYDELGRMISGQREGDSYVVELTDFTDYSVGSNSWTMEYSPNAMVLGDLEMEVEAIYSEADTIEGHVGTMEMFRLRTPW